MRRCPAVRRSRAEHEAEAGVAPAKTPGWGGSRIARGRYQGHGSLAMEIDIERHGAPPRAPWRGTFSSRHGEGRLAQPLHAPWRGRLRRRSLPSCASPGASCQGSPPPPLRPQCPSLVPARPSHYSLCFLLDAIVSEHFCSWAGNKTMIRIASWCCSESAGHMFS
jgi:hypothetical protein